MRERRALFYSAKERVHRDRREVDRHRRWIASRLDVVRSRFELIRRDWLAIIRSRLQLIGAWLRLHFDRWLPGWRSNRWRVGYSLVVRRRGGRLDVARVRVGLHDVTSARHAHGRRVDRTVVRHHRRRSAEDLHRWAGLQFHWLLNDRRWDHWGGRVDWSALDGLLSVSVLEKGNGEERK